MTPFGIILVGFLIVSVAFLILLAVFPSFYAKETCLIRETAKRKGSSGTRKPRDKIPKTSVQVVVLGDIGRSPRMQYHAISIAKYGGRVDLIGYRESEPLPELLSNPYVSIIAIPPPPPAWKTESKLLFLIYGPLKALFQTWSLWNILAYQTHAARWMLVQNPPSIPTLAVAYLVCVLRNTHLIIDWHNFGWSILALRLGRSHPLVRCAKWYEYFFGGLASANFTVTDAMARLLKEEYRITSPILTLHDRPPVNFQSVLPEDREDGLNHIRLTEAHAFDILRGRTRLVVSSTSWTADEDFSMLLQALVEYSRLSRRQPPLIMYPHLLVIITGKGPLKAQFLAEVKRLQKADALCCASVHTTWLSAEDYALLLGIADVGLSLHTSSSGVDLPMKVVDMFGAGLPVLGWKAFEAWPELVQERVNGLGFDTVAGLTDCLLHLFAGADQGRGLRKLKQGAISEGARRWDDEWRPVAGRVLGLCD